MAQITIDVPNAVLARVLDAFAKMYGRPETIPDPANPTGPQIPNPQTKAQFAKMKLADFIKDVVKGHEAQKAGGDAQKAALDKAAADTAQIS